MLKLAVEVQGDGDGCLRGMSEVRAGGQVQEQGSLCLGAGRYEPSACCQKDSADPSTDLCVCACVWQCGKQVANVSCSLIFVVCLFRIAKWVHLPVVSEIV